MSWVSNWAEKGGSFLNTLDSRVADLLKNADEIIDPPTYESITVSKADKPQTQPVSSSSSSSAAPQPAVASVPSTERINTAQQNMLHQKMMDRDEALFEFLNNSSTPVDQISIIHANHQEPLQTGPQKPKSEDDESLVSSVLPNVAIPLAGAVSQQKDILEENRLLHNEVAALNQEVSGFLKRRKKLEEESQQLRNQMELVMESLKVANARVRELELHQVQPISQSTNQQEAKEKIEKEEEEKLRLCELTSELETVRNSLTKSQQEVQEISRQAELASIRADQSQEEGMRTNQRLSEYKEKAAHVLAAKDKAIAELQSRCSNGGVPNSSLQTVSLEMEGLRGELDLLRDEASTLRAEIERRDVAAIGLEEHWQQEHAELRRGLAEARRQLEREQQIRHDAECELTELQRAAREQTERVAREKSELHSLLQSNEAELARMRRALAEGGGFQQLPSSCQQTLLRAPPPRTDAEQLLAMEARLRQLTDSLVTKQDALDAVLAQNHGLKIRLERYEAESDAHLLSTVNSKGESSSTSSSKAAALYLPISSSNATRLATSGFARLHLIDTSLPRTLRGFVTSWDGMMIRLVGFLRRRPLFRLLFIFYLFILHIWFFLAFFVLSPFSVSPSNLPPH